jgi:hypothetical protein
VVDTCYSFMAIVLQLIQITNARRPRQEVYHPVDVSRARYPRWWPHSARAFCYYNRRHKSREEERVYEKYKKGRTRPKGFH